MAIFRIDPDSELRPTVPSGVYGENEEATVVSSKQRPMDPNDPDTGEWWDLGIGIRTEKGVVFAHTQRLGPHNCQLVKGSGSKAMRFARQLGVQRPEDGFDDQELIGLPVVVEVKLREFVTKAGEKGESLDVVNLHKR